MPGKTSKIPLYETDNPEEVANNFAKIYCLTKENRDDLLKVLKEQHDILTATNKEKSGSKPQENQEKPTQ